MITMELPEITSTVIAVISMFSVVYSAIVMKKAGAAVFLLQIQTPISIVKRFLKLSRGRQKYLVGRTKLPPDTVYHKLVATGYQWDYFAYNDDGEQVSMRKLYSDRQVHVRAFDDGTIRMHDEFNYEIEPVRHLQVPLVPASRVEIEAVIAALEVTPEIDSKEYDTPIEYVMKRLGEKDLPTG
jgi:hypothetical protein